jgi:LPXTG-motif cell wall-anchored protein
MTTKQLNATGYAGIALLLVAAALVVKGRKK